MRYKKEKLGIYGIFITVNGKEICIYTGRGDLQDREHYHWSRCRNHKHRNKGIQKYWNEYDGESNFEFRILEYCTKKNYKEKEDYWMKYYAAPGSDKPPCNTRDASNYSYNTNTYKKQKVKEHRSQINSGELNPRSKHTPEEIIYIKKLFAEGRSIQDIREIIGETYQYLYMIKKNIRWKHISLDDNQNIY